VSRFGRRERRVALAIFDAIFPSGANDRVPMGASDVDMEGFLEDLEASYPPAVQLGVRGLLWLIELTAWARTGWSYADLPRDVREKIFASWYRSRFYLFRQAAVSIKAIAGLGYCGFPEVQESFGYHKPRAAAPLGPLGSGGRAGAARESRRRRDGAEGP
jgi:hypothetical protein